MERTLPRLKATHLIPPAAALVLVGILNTTQIRSISSLQTETTALREKISTAFASGNFPQDPTLAKEAAKTTGPVAKSAIGWKELSALLGDENAGDEKARIRAMNDFHERLAEMSREEMIAALDEIAGLDLTDEQRRALEEEIVGPLIKQDPEYALKRFADRLGSDPDGIGWKLSDALRDWAKKDLSAATAWFDRQIAEGNFDSKTLDGRSETRVKFEAALMESLLSSDPAAAGRRLAEIPEDQRREVLQQLPFEELGPAERQAYTELVRGLIPADEREGSFAHIASQLAGEDGYGKVTAFLDAVQATPAERAAAAVQAAESRLESLALRENVTRKDVDQLREWLEHQAPGKVDRITGKALAEAAQDDGKFQFQEASQLVLHYQKASGSDDVLVSFLRSYAARSNIEEAIHLADMITDTQRRAQILAELK